VERKDEKGRRDKREEGRRAGRRGEEKRKGKGNPPRSFLK